MGKGHGWGGTVWRPDGNLVLWAVANATAKAKAKKIGKGQKKGEQIL